MFNHSHGLWGYTGLAADREPMTIQATGIGAPSAAIVLDELIGLGLRRAVAVGTCVGLPSTGDSGAPPLGLGDVMIAEAAVCGDGTSRSLGAGEADATPDPALTRALRDSRPSHEARRGRVISTDLLYGPDDLDLLRGIGDRGVLAAEMEAAALFTLGARRRVAVGCVLVVADLLTSAGLERLADDGLALAQERAGRLAAAGLGWVDLPVG